MWYSLAADLTVVIHGLFIVFATLGAFLVLKWPRLVWGHVPAAIWAILVELNSWICPLTPLENRFRAAAGEQGYEGGFIQHYLVPLIYPDGLTPAIQIWIGVAIIAVNIGVYAVVYRRWREKKPPRR